MGEAYRVLKPSGFLCIVDQEDAPFNLIKRVMDGLGFKMVREEVLRKVYDHGRVSNAILLLYSK